MFSRRASGRPSVCVDVGCGTGRFTKVLAAAYGRRVVGIDPSRPMLTAAAKLLGAAGGVSFVLGRAEALPLADGCADVVLMSMSYHHVTDKPAALAAVRRTLRRNGMLFVRTCSREALDSYLYQRFFPEARRFDEMRFPTSAGLQMEVAREGFRLKLLDIVRQRVSDDLRDYRERTALRSHSDLQAITDDQFRAGMARFDAWLAKQSQHRPVIEEVDLFGFTVA